VSALLPLSGFRHWICASRAWEGRGLDPQLAEALRGAISAAEAVPAAREVEFVDSDGDPIRFCLASGGPGACLEVAIGGQPARRVSRLRLAAAGRALRFVAEPGGEALQVGAPSEVVARGDLVRVARLAGAPGLVPELREPVLRLAYEYLTRRELGGRHAADRAVDFHLSGGARLHALHWQADESTSGLAESLGVMASFVYSGGSDEAARAAAYALDGLDASMSADA